jgi:hypothetical protein
MPSVVAQQQGKRGKWLCEAGIEFCEKRTIPYGIQEKYDQQKNKSLLTFNLSTKFRPGSKAKSSRYDSKNLRPEFGS